ncbi:MAG: hypothetical protein JWO87_2289 [Phycisphaerales bacterium]|nr:hypothetical protein [Phycisphaerales bacterium]
MCKESVSQYMAFHLPGRRYHIRDDAIGNNTM